MLSALAQSLASMADRLAGVPDKHCYGAASEVTTWMTQCAVVVV